MIQAYTFETMGDGPVRQRMIRTLTIRTSCGGGTEISVNGAWFSLVEEYEYMFTDDERAST